MSRSAVANQSWPRGWAGASVREGIDILKQARDPHLQHTQERGPRLHALDVLRPQPRNAARNTTRRAGFVSAWTGKHKQRELLEAAMADEHDTLSEQLSKRLLSAYGIRTTEPQLAKDARRSRCGWPVKSATPWR